MDFEINPYTGERKKIEMIVSSIEVDVNGTRQSFYWKYYGNLDSIRFNQESANQQKPGYKVKYLGPFQDGDLERNSITEGMKERGFKEGEIYVITDVSRCRK